jgi:N-formylmaleamate deformylase
MPGSGWTVGATPVTGGELVYHRTGGAGPALVLSHGLTDNGLCWSRFAAEMAGDFDVIMIDARGHGGSARPTAGVVMDPAGDLAEAIAALGLENPIVMGHSVGARATAAYANGHPGNVRKVILEDPVFLALADAEAAAARRARFRSQVGRFKGMSHAEILATGRKDSPGWHDDDLPDWAMAKHQVDPEALPPYATPWQEEVDRIAAPTLIVHGEPRLGSLITASIGDEARALNPNIRTIEVAGAGHNVRRENFTGFLAAVRAFLRS